MGNTPLTMFSHYLTENHTTAAKSSPETKGVMISQINKSGADTGKCQPVISVQVCVTLNAVELFP
jgi:hypothetical protein